MNTWYECKIKYSKVDNDGRERKVSDNYLFDSVSYSDAESRVFKQMEELTSGDFQIVNIKKSNVTEIIPAEEGEWWYKAKISLVTIDEEAGKEKKVSQYILVMADDLKQALTRLNEGLSYLVVPYVVTSLQLVDIADVFPYFEDETETSIPSHLTPMSEIEADEDAKEEETTEETEA